MNSQLNISLAQVEASSHPEKNLDVAKGLAREAAKEHSDLLVLPEMYMAVPEEGKAPSDYAQDIQGPFVTGLCDIASRNNIYLIAGIWESIASVDLPGNTIVLISPRGELLSAYRKLHLFDALNRRESDKMTYGSNLPDLFYINGFCLGWAICYDLRFPELFRMLTMKGAEVFILPSAWYKGEFKQKQWLTLLGARAVENTVFVAGCNQVGENFCGRSAVVDPFGMEMADLKEDSCLQTIGIQKQRLLEVRDGLPVLWHRRNDVYELREK